MFFDSVFYLFIFVLSVQCAYDRSEGEPCQLEGKVGKCVHVYKCLSSILDLKEKNYPPICSFQSTEPVICCLDCELVNDTRNAVVDNGGGIFFKTGQKARDNCLNHLKHLPFPCNTKGVERVWDEQRECHAYETLFKTSVFGGRDAERSKYPHMALLGYGDDKDSAQWLCGGSLISERFVLTAAHCISETVIGPVRFVALGILKRTDPDKYWQIYNVRRTIAHPEYRPPSKYHDIALLETVQPVKYSKDVFPACLDYSGKQQDYAFATGWGKLGKGRPLADTLQEVALDMFSKEECLKNFPPHRLLTQGYHEDSQMCYGVETEPKDTCEGDSGGPLQVASELSSCMHSVIGVTSFGRACGYAGGAGMYTRVRSYVPWVESVVWPGKVPLQVTSKLSSCMHSVIGVTTFGRACGYAGGAGMYTRVRSYVPWVKSYV